MSTCATDPKPAKGLIPQLTLTATNLILAVDDAADLGAAELRSSEASADDLFVEDAALWLADLVAAG